MGNSAQRISGYALLLVSKWLLSGMAGGVDAQVVWCACVYNANAAPPLRRRPSFFFCHRFLFWRLFCPVASWRYLLVALFQRRRTNDITDPFSLSIWRCARNEAPCLNRWVGAAMCVPLSQIQTHTLRILLIFCVFIAFFGAWQG